MDAVCIDFSGSDDINITILGDDVVAHLALG
jgi:hypothetical protein